MTIKQRIKKYWPYLLILYVPLYIGMFLLVEKAVPTTGYWVSYCKLDDFIPFCEYFVIPYYCWYPYLVLIGVYLLIKDLNEYKLYMYALILGFTISLIICLVFPSGQDLRPISFEHDNLFVDLVKKLYEADTNTNVIPSVHVYGAIIGAVAVIRTKEIKHIWIKVTVVIVCILIIASTCFIKQHSALDTLAALALIVIVYSVMCIIIKMKKIFLKIS